MSSDSVSGTSCPPNLKSSIFPEQKQLSARLEAFLGQLHEAMGKGSEVERLVVEGQEMNIVVRARKARGRA